MRFKCQYPASCCQSADAVQERTVQSGKVDAGTPPVSDDSMTVESAVESVEDRSTRSVPIVDALKQADANTPPVSDQSVASKSVVEREMEEKKSLDKQNSLATISLRSVVDPIADASKQVDTDTPPVSDRSVASKSVDKKEEEEKSTLSDKISLATTSLRDIVGSFVDTSKQPPVSDHIVASEPVAKDEEDKLNSFGNDSDSNSNSLRSSPSSTKPDRVSAIEEGPSVGDDTIPLPPIVDASKQTVADTPPVSDCSVASKSGVEEEEDEHGSLTETSVRSIVKEDIATDRSAQSVPTIDTFKETDANTPPLADDSVTLEAAVEKIEKQNLMTENNVRSIVEEDLAEKKAEKESYNCFTSFFCCGGDKQTSATSSKAIAS